MAAIAAVGKDNAANGSAALSFVNSDTTATLTDVNMRGFTKADVDASETGQLRTLAGNLTVGTTGADVGGALVWGQVSDSEIAARISGSSIDLGEGASLIVTAIDETTLSSLAAGFAFGAKFAFGGAGSINTISKSGAAEILNTSVNSSGAQTGRVLVESQNASKIKNIAAVVAASGTAAISASVAVNRIDDTTSARLDGETLNVSALALKAQSAATISNVSAGGAGAGTGTIAGSVVVNSLSGGTKAELKNAAVSTRGNIGVIAQSDSSIASFIGTLQGAGTAAIGASIGVNLIADSTEALVADSSLTALGQSGKKLTVFSGMDDDKIYSVSVEGFEALSDPNVLADSRNSSELSGVVIDSSATRNLSTTLVSAGGDGAVAVEASINVNTLSGSTTASLSGSSVNGPKAGGAVSVRAADYSNAASSLAAVAVSGTASVGGIVDTTISDRNVSAAVTGAVGKKLYSDSLPVTADSKQGVASLAAGGAGSGIAAVAASVSINSFKGSTTASISNLEATTGSLTLESSHLAKLAQIDGNASVGGVAGVGASIGVASDSSFTAAVLKDSVINMKENNSGVSIKADNRLEGYAAGVAVSGGGIGAAVGIVSVNGAESQVLAQMSGSTIGSAETRAAKIDIASSNKTKLITVSGGAASIGVSVGVNLFESSSVTLLDNSSLYSLGAVRISSRRDLDTKQHGYSASGSTGLAGTANVMITIVDGSAELGERKAATLVRSATINAGGNLTASANDDTNSRLSSGTVALGGVSVGGNVSVLNVNRGAEMEISGSTLASEGTLTLSSVLVSLGETKGTALSAAALSISSQLNPAVSAEANGLAVAGGMAAGVSFSEAKAEGSSLITLGSDNVYDANSMDVYAQVGSNAGALEVSAKTLSYGGALLASVAYNKALASSSTTSGVTINGGTFATASDLTVRALNRTFQNSDVGAMTIGGLVAAGFNYSESSSSNIAKVELNNTRAQTPNSLKAAAKNDTMNESNANGDGGGLIVAEGTGGYGARAVRNVDNTTTRSSRERPSL